MLTDPGYAAQPRFEFKQTTLAGKAYRRFLKDIEATDAYLLKLSNLFQELRNMKTSTFSPTPIFWFGEQKVEKHREMDEEKASQDSIQIHASIGKRRPSGGGTFRREW
jgi:hypothetical protein